MGREWTPVDCDMYWLTLRTFYCFVFVAYVEVRFDISLIKELIDWTRFTARTLYKSDKHRRETKWTKLSNVNYCVYVMWVAKALEVIRTALGDPWVRTGRRYSLLQRAKKICQSAAVKKSSRSHNLWQDFAGDRMSDVREPQSVTTMLLIQRFVFK